MAYPKHRVLGRSRRYLMRLKVIEVYRKGLPRKHRAQTGVRRDGRYYTRSSNKYRLIRRTADAFITEIKAAGGEKSRVIQEKYPAHECSRFRRAWDTLSPVA